MSPVLALMSSLFLLLPTAMGQGSQLAPRPAGVAAARTSSARPATAVSPGGSWTTYHHDDAHSGFDPAAPTLGAVGPTPGWTDPGLDGEVYAEPLIYNGLVYAVTLNDTVYAIDRASGAIVWSKNLGVPQTGGWSCGNVSPQGILGTPVIDTAASRIYAVAELAGPTVSSPATYHLFGLDLATGTTMLNILIAPTGFDWKVQQERGALALANGYVYVPFGGRAGDCFDTTTTPATPYFGWVVGVPTSGTGSNNVLRTPSTAESVWAAGGIAVDDSTGNILFATGNAIPCAGAAMSDAVVRANSTLSATTYFQPNDWQANWCGPDSDLGSASPLIISPTLAFQAGKHGGGFLVNPSNLGGVDGQLFPTPRPAAYSQADVCLGNTSDATFASFAYAAPFVYVECDGGRGLVALSTNTVTPSFSPCNAACAAPDWHAGSGLTFGPPIVAAGAVWVANDGGGLYAFNASTGAQIFHSAGFGVNRFVTPAEAGGQVFVPSHTVIKSFTFGGFVSATPAQLDFNGQAVSTTSSVQTVTLHNNTPVALNVATASVTGVNSANYIKGADTCTGQTVASGGSCAVQVSFRPASFGGLPASLTFTDSGSNSPQTVPLNGMGALDDQGRLYTLDGWGGLHADGTSPPLSSSAYWPGWNIARGLAVFPDGLGGYTLDGWGGLHPFGNAPVVGNFTYWPYWDIARQVVLAPWSNQANPAGWTLDGWGGIHPFGSAPAISGFAYWPNWDIARGLVILPDSTPGAVAGYTLDGYGGLHPFGGAPAITNFAYWGWDIARGITLSPNASKSNPAGWTLDGWGGVHAFGTAPAESNFTYWPGWDIARGVVAWTGSGAGGWVMDAWGGIHPFGAAPAVSPFAYWPGWQIAASLGGPDFSTGSRRRT